MKTKSKSQQLLVYTLKTIIVLSKFEFLLHIYNMFLFDRDFLFESVNTINLFIYAHVVDLEIKVILIKNEEIYSIKTFKKF